MEYLKIKKKFNLREKLLLSSIIFIFFIFFYYIGILKYYIPAVHLNSQIEIFYDSKTVSSWIECYKYGIDILKKNNCTINSTSITYGNIILLLPINEYLKLYYNLIFPIIIFFFYIFINLYFYKSKKISHLILILLVICNQRNILAFERGQIDIYVYILVILLAYNNKNYFIIFFKNLFLCILTLTKIYPFILITYTLFFKKKNFLILIFLIPTFFFIFYNQSHYQHILNLIPSPDIRWDFSFKALPKYFKNYIFFTEYYNYLISIIFLLIIIIILKKRFPNDKYFKFDSFEERLFLLSGNVVIFCYFFSHNYYYREIFFSLCIPFFILIFNKIKKTNIIYYFILIRYFFILIFNHFIMFRYNYSLAIIQQIFDLILVGILLFFSFIINFKYLKKIIS